MNIYEQVTLLLKEKKIIALELEELTNKLCSQNIETLPNVSKAHGIACEKIKNITQEISDLCKDDIELRNALNHVSDKSDLSLELDRLFDLSFSIKTIANRISKLDAIVTLHLESEKSRIVSSIEHLNSEDVSTKASKYQISAATVPTNKHLDQKSKWV